MINDLQTKLRAQYRILEACAFLCQDNKEVANYLHKAAEHTRTIATEIGADIEDEIREYGETYYKPLLIRHAIKNILESWSHAAGSDDERERLLRKIEVYDVRMS